MLATSPRAVLCRPRRTFFLVLTLVSVYYLLSLWKGTSDTASALRQGDFFRIDEDNTPYGNRTSPADIHIENKKSESKIRHDFEREEKAALRKPGAGKLYGGTVENLVRGDSQDDDGTLTEWNNTAGFSAKRPAKFNPYPDYNSRAWRKAGHARYVACEGPQGQPVDDISAFVGLPQGFPSPSFGSYELFGINQNLCFERDTRLGLYKMLADTTDEVSWGRLQSDCVARNEQRFDLDGPRNEFLGSAYKNIGIADSEAAAADDETKSKRSPSDGVWGRTEAGRRFSRPETETAETATERVLGGTKYKTEPRTAVLLRSYTGKKYTENDQHNIRSLVSELSLRSGGKFQVFLLVHVKGRGVDLWDNETYDKVLEKSVAKEFRSMTLLWNDDLVQNQYPLLERSSEASVHNAQYLSVQKFMQEFREFDFVWNWEMDARVTGQSYDMLTRLGAFAKKQPRKGLWERNGRFYIPDFHGDYDTAFRMSVEAGAGNDTVWGAPEVPFINPVGPKPPTDSPQDEDYSWGVGEEADLITLSPLFDTQDSKWILRDQVWRYNDANHTSKTLPRRGSIVTQCRLSRKLLDIMHVENMRGNHVGSELAPGTVAFLHGLKAVYAPMPVFMDRPWQPSRLARWFNGGPRGGASGGRGCAMGWGREGRFRGVTWYYRAEPPQRLYNNWAGFEDHGIGGPEWEQEHGRPCLPAMFLHPVKDIVPTKPGYKSKLNLPY